MLALILGGALAAIHYLGETASSRLEKYHIELMSTSSGVLIALMFLDLLPTAVTDERNFSLLFFGFILFHSLEKYIYQRHPAAISEKTASIWGFFLTNFVAGAGVGLIFAKDQASAIILMIPLGLSEMATSTMLGQLISKAKNHEAYKILLSMSVFLGTFISVYLLPDASVENSLLAFVLGCMLYVVIRDMLPKNKEGRIDFFLLGGVATYLLLMLM